MLCRSIVREVLILVGHVVEKHCLNCRFIAAPPVPFDGMQAGVLITVRDLSALPIDGFRAEVEPGESAVITVSALQSRMVHHAERGEWVFEQGWRIFMGADARVITPELLGFFISRLKSLIEIPSTCVS